MCVRPFCSSQLAAVSPMAPKKKGGDKKKDAKKGDAGGEEYKPPKPLVPATGAFRHNEHFFEKDERGLEIMHTRSFDSDAIVGEEVLEYGSHRWAIQLCSHGQNTHAANYGTGVCVGVTEADFEATDVGGGRAWGISFPTRRFTVTHDCYLRGNLAFALGQAPFGDFDGMVLHFELDMGPELRHENYGLGGSLAARMVQRTMYVAINDGPFVECCRNLPPAVRVWALLASEGDTVGLMPPTRQRPTTKESDKYAAGLRPKDL